MVCIQILIYVKDRLEFIFYKYEKVKFHISKYSFRHTGAIRLFEKTKDITKLQKAMGHSSMRVSLTYLRGLEITDLKEEDMPMV